MQIVDTVQYKFDKIFNSGNVKILQHADLHVILHLLMGTEGHCIFALCKEVKVNFQKFQVAVFRKNAVPYNSPIVHEHDFSNVNLRV